MVQSFFDMLGNSWLASYTNSQTWVFVTAETAHFIGLSILFGALLVVDLRVLGVARFINMQAAMKFIPVAIIGFSINLFSALIFIAANPTRYTPNIAFQWKMGLIFLAGLNALWFWFGEHRQLVRLADGEDADFRAKVIAGVSLLLWVLVLYLGRMIPFVE